MHIAAVNGRVERLHFGDTRIGGCCGVLKSGSRLRLERSTKRLPEFLHEAGDELLSPHQRLLLVRCWVRPRALAQECSPEAGPAALCRALDNGGDCPHALAHDGLQALQKGSFAGADNLLLERLEQVLEAICCSYCYSCGVDCAVDCGAGVDGGVCCRISSLLR
eukprot:scaffold70798_cov64-Phaeocystis_antarctica.AAC.2